MSASANVAVAGDSHTQNLLKAILDSLEDSKSEDITSINMDGKSTITDAMVIASGRSQRHVSAIADHLIRDLKTSGLGSFRMEGKAQCDWVLIDANDVIVHLFRPEVREFYDLEKLWSLEPQ